MFYNLESQFFPTDVIIFVDDFFPIVGMTTCPTFPLICCQTKYSKMKNIFLLLFICICRFADKSSLTIKRKRFKNYKSILDSFGLVEYHL